MEREVGGGIGMGNTCNSMAVSFQCMTKSTTIKIIIIILKESKSVTEDMLFFQISMIAKGYRSFCLFYTVMI